MLLIFVITEFINKPSIVSKAVSILTISKPHLRNASAMSMK